MSNFHEDDRLDTSSYYKIDYEKMKNIISLDESHPIEKIMYDKLEKAEGDLYTKYFTSYQKGKDESDEEVFLHNFGVIDQRSRKYSIMIPEYILSKLFELEIITEVTKESEIAQLLLLGIDTSFKGV